MKKSIILFYLLVFNSFNLISQDKGIKDKVIGFFSKDSLTSKKFIILKSFSYTNNNLKTINHYESITLNKDSKNTIQGATVADTDFKLKEFNNSEFFFSNDNIYIIDEEENLTVFNTSNDYNSRLEYNLLEQVLTFSKIVKNKVEGIYLANSCYVKKEKEDGSYTSRNYIFGDILDNNVKQLIIKTDKFIYLYKINIRTNEITINTDFEPIFRFQLRHHYNPFKSSVIESIYLNKKKTAIEKFENEYTDFGFDLSGQKFEWHANNDQQIFSFKKIGVLNSILDEI
jgi:hypothetical protein